MDPAAAGCRSCGSVGGDGVGDRRRLWMKAASRFGFAAAIEVLYICSILGLPQICDRVAVRGFFAPKCHK